LGAFLVSPAGFALVMTLGLLACVWVRLHAEG
jgi:hypothetical protein